MTAYYNEINPYAAAWLRNLIAEGLIPHGVVDERSIEDVKPVELAGYTQWHFFAGIGVWPLALRRAGWPDERRIVTGSCPCQPFSSAGEGGGFVDERHLWPALKHHLRFLRSPVVAGEQVASRDAEPWLDLVHADMEAMGYAFGAVALPAAGFGAPHIRDRTFWLGHTDDARLEGHAGHDGPARGQGAQRPVAAPGVPVRLADAHGDRFTPGAELRLHDAQRDTESRGCAGRLGDASIGGQAQGSASGGGPGGQGNGPADDGDVDRSWAGAVGGLWRDSDWLACRDSKWRPVEPGTSPLAYGLPLGLGQLSAGEQRLAALAGLDAASLRRAKEYRVGSLSGYGNAINAAAGEHFIRAYLEYEASL